MILQTFSFFWFKNIFSNLFYYQATLAVDSYGYNNVWDFFFSFLLRENNSTKPKFFCVFSCVNFYVIDSWRYDWNWKEDIVYLSWSLKSSRGDTHSSDNPCSDRRIMRWASAGTKDYCPLKLCKKGPAPCSGWRRTALRKWAGAGASWRTRNAPVWSRRRALSMEPARRRALSMEPAFCVGPVAGGRQSETSMEGLAELGLAACAAGPWRRC